MLGPFHKINQRGKHYVLTIVAFGTAFLEEIPLSNISTLSVARSLMSYFCKHGIPQTLRTDLGMNFVSELMKKCFDLAKITHQTSLAYSRWCSGLVVWYN